MLEGRPLLDRRATLAGMGALAAAPAAASMSTTALDWLYGRAEADLEAKTEAHVGTWHLDKAKWDVDLDAGIITFRNPRGWIITAPVQVIGTRSSRDGTWLWGWDHPSVRPGLAKDAVRVRDYGKAHGIVDFTTRKLPASEQQCWRFTAVANYLAKANGAYRGPTSEATVFMTFGTIEIAGR